jgi:magnesium-transporting ATPase (P-type)
MSTNNSNLRAMVLGLMALRAFIGALLIGMPWIVGEGLDRYGATSVGLGVAVVAAATQMHRAPWLRWVQLALAFAVMFVPFVFPSDDISMAEVVYSSLTGFMLMVSAIVTPQLFAQETSERTSASEASRSEGSKTSSVSTPPN